VSEPCGPQAGVSGAIVCAVFPFEQEADAHCALESPQSRGKMGSQAALERFSRSSMENTSDGSGRRV
jgi:hypothetical protein